MEFDITIISSEDITTGAASAQSSAAPAGTTHARLSATVSARARTGTNPTAVAADSLFKATDPAVFIKIAVGDKVAAIQDAAAGKLNVTFVRASRI